MKYILLFSLAVIVTGVSMSQTWINSNSEQDITKVQLLRHDNSFNITNSIYQSLGYVITTFSNGNQTTSDYYSTNSLFAPAFFLGEDQYEYYTIYKITPSRNLSSETSDGLAFKVINGELCVGYFGYTFKLPSVTIFELGCFKPDKKILPIASKVELDYLQKLTKAQLIEIIKGKKPTFPIAPVCLSCPPWKEYEKSKEALKKFKFKTFKIEVQEVNK